MNELNEGIYFWHISVISIIKGIYFATSVWDFGLVSLKDKSCENPKYVRRPSYFWYIKGYSG